MYIHFREARIRLDLNERTGDGFLMNEELMSERDKMIAGLPYLPTDPGLCEDRLRAATILHELNALPPGRMDECISLLTNLFGKMGGQAGFALPLRCDYGYNIEIGDRFFANYNLVILDCAKVIIGDDVMIGPNVSIYTAQHPLDPWKRAELIETTAQVKIGNRVWIGGSATILPGVTIGDNAVIGAGSVVVKDIPANAVAVGNPCRVVRMID